MMENEYVDRQTKFFINRVYRRHTPSYSKIFAYLSEAGIKYTHPIICNGMSGFEILHPLHSHRIYGNPNNSSAIVSIGIGQEKFVIPGDIENGCSTEGWDEVSMNQKNKIQRAKYYMLSHHGSKNGFCSNAVPSNALLSFCSTRPRTNYNGVPHKNTLSLSQNVASKLYRTDNSPNIHYIEVDFTNGTAVYK